MKVKMSERFFYKVEDENFDVYKNFNTSKENILRNNEELKLYKGEWIMVKMNDFISHYVKPTETLDIISNKYSLNKIQIIRDNNLENEKLFIGQLIKIYKR